MRENHYATIVSLFENFSGFQSYKISITPLYILICLGDGIHQIAAPQKVDTERWKTDGK